MRGTLLSRIGEQHHADGAGAEHGASAHGHYCFELVLMPYQGSLWLHVRGPAGSKEVVADFLRIQEGSDPS